MHLRHYLWAVLVPVLLIAVGTLGYMAIEHWTMADSLYMTIITITTVGYMEVHPLSPLGRTFTMALLMGGVFTVLYAATTVIAGLVSGEIGGKLEKQRMERTLANLEGHTIVCGYGRMGRLVCAEFSAHDAPFVIIDRQADLLAGLHLPSGIALVGDATEDEVLRRAGVERARVLVTLATSDSENLYITMSARLLNEKLHIVARAEDEDAEKKLLRAGATRVISPYVIGGHRVAQAVLRPHVVDFLELATRHDYPELQIEESLIAARSPLAGVRLKDSGLRSELGVVIVAVKRRGGAMTFNPDPEVILEAGDLLITLGHRDQLRKLEALAVGGPG